MSRRIDPTPVWGDRGPTAATGREAKRALTVGAASDAPDKLAAAIGAAWATLLARYTRERRVTFFARRGNALIPVSVTVDPQQTVDMLRSAVVNAAAAASDLEPGDVSAGSVFVLDTSASSSGAKPALEIGAAKGATPTLSFAEGRFDDWTMDQIAVHLSSALAYVIANPSALVATIPMVDDAMRKLLLEDWNATTVRWREGDSIARIFEDQVDATPDAAAVEINDERLTYRQLDERANQFAQYLRKRGVETGQSVAMCLDRSMDTIVTLLGIIKAGAAYVPLEPTYPRERLAFMLRDTTARLLITQASLAAKLPDDVCPVIDVANVRAEIQKTATSRLTSETNGTSIAYIMYTSGSTGTPKGVQVLHCAINRLVCGIEYAKLGPNAAVLHAGPLAFDASTFEIWGALLTGGRSILYPERIPTPDGVRATVKRHGVTTAWLTAGLFNALVDEDADALRGIQQLLTGGEALSPSHVRRAQEVIPDIEFINGYGPTETTTFALTLSIPRPVPTDAASIPIGKPLRDTQVYVLDASRQLVGPEVPGELFIAGVGLAAGYINRPDLTEEKFVANPFGEGRMYRTGDIVQWRRTGVIAFMGRVDDQVKIRGFRIELGEIAAALSAHPDIRRAAVTTRVVAETRDKQIVAYLTVNDGATRPAPATLRDFLRATLPDYMVPTHFVFVDAIPLTDNGKVDFRAMPDPVADVATPDDPSFIAPANEREEVLAAVIAAVIGTPKISVVANIFELGASSLAVVRASTRLRTERGWQIPVVRFFEFPTIRALAASMEDRAGAASRVQAVVRPRDRSASDPIAIVGMAARLPGAPNVREYWRNLMNGVDSVANFGAKGVDPLVPSVLRDDPAYITARGVLEDVDKFDAGFFGMTPREAQLMDPQQRLFLELSWTALEDAGYVPDQTDVPIGIFGGVYNNSYQATLLSRRPDLVEQYGAFNAMLLNEKDYVATRAAHKLGLTGPALSIHTACSTSLVAICQAVQSLRDGQCGIALAGGVSLTIPTRSGYLYQEGGMLSADGKTRSFDSSATGTVFSDGAGVIVLKRLSDAQRDRDSIYAVIRGIAVNNDGSNKASFTAPSVEGQATVVASAHADAGVSARDISYVEAHGTATPLGDPIEVEALTRAFRLTTEDSGYCALGSVKSNIGHTVIAAGVAGVIKTALALREEVIPASLHYRAPNPAISFETSPFVVVSSQRAWPRSETPRRAGVSSFGVGGTNAHVILEEAPQIVDSDNGRPEQVLPLSARSAAALEAASNALAEALRNDESLNLADVAYTLQVGRRAFPSRRSIAAATREEAIALLTGADAREKTEWQKRAPVSAPDVAFMFPGQGSQYVGMGSMLYEHEPVFREEMDRLFAASRDVMQRDLRAAMFGTTDPDAAARDLRETSVTQPALFAIEYALAKLWESFGVVPATMIGHSVGEFVAATLAGVFSPEDAMRLVATRGQLMGSMPHGSMLSVRLDSDVVAKRLTPDLAIASDNAPGLCVVAGPTPEVEALRDKLVAEDVACSMLHTSHAFHSAMMEPAVEQFDKALRSVTMHAPTRRFISCVTGAPVTAAQATDPSYWSRHLRQTVRFADGAKALAQDAKILLEVGPRTTLASLAKLTVRDAAVTVTSLKDSPTTELKLLLGAAGDLWRRGVEIDWLALHVGERRHRIALPKYQFERASHWVALKNAAGDVATPTLIAEATTRDETVAQDAARVVTKTPVVPAVYTSIPSAASVSSQAVPSIEPEQRRAMSAVSSSSQRRDRLRREIGQTFEQVAGIEVTADDASASFVELGFDSLTLTQVALAISKAQGIKISFRQLLEDQSSLELLVDFIDAALPPEVAAPAAVPAAPTPVAAAAQIAVGSAPNYAPAPIQAPSYGYAPMSASPVTPGSQSVMQAVIDQQLRLMQQQLAMLSGMPAMASAPMAAPQPVAPQMPAVAPQSQNGGSNGSAPVPSTPQSAEAPSAVATARPTTPHHVAPAAATDGEESLTTGPRREFYDAKKAFGAAPRITRHVTEELTPKQRARLDAFIRRYTSRTKGSKKFTQDNRGHMADPRVATGFRPPVKELVYPIVIEKSKGSRIWDIDGNEYIDVLSGFGSNMFGWSAPFVVDAVKEQMEKGFEIGPQHVLTAEVTQLFRDVTKTDRVAFCNTGSEAILGAIRVARTTTGRNLIVAFSGSYHGIIDEVIVRGNKKGKAFPAAPGILPTTAENILVLDYGTPESLQTIRDRSDEIAAVLVEAVQSRRPDFQPAEFLRDLRSLTTEKGIVYIWDEIVTGFRAAPGGAQEHFGIQADLGTYGKVVGGGLSIGVIAGKREFMDALDGGHWQFGDASVPEVGVTYFAGTFVRHPLALASARAVLKLVKEKGPALQQGLTALTARLAKELNTWFTANGVPIEIRHFSSVWKTFFTADVQNTDLLFYMLRDRGIHIYEGFPCFMTMAHTDADIDKVIAAFKESVNELREASFMPDNGASKARFDAKTPPVAGARLGRDKNGNPAWFVIDPSTGQPKEFTPA
ncbi:MAG TPA: amino acid adenylation domain-containing protein [Gemmatimonadaceae bacterium]|jgi:amino acid adenylation domain-containing protein